MVINTNVNADININNNASTNITTSITPPNRVPVPASDWATAPDPSTKRTVCGIGALITVYTNGRFSVGPFHCHRWDCPSCAAAKREMYCRKILNISPIWYAVEINDSEYVAVQKRISRAGGKYIGVGGGNHWLMLVDDEGVLPGAELLGGEELPDAINDILTLSHTPHQHRIRHSDGLFPAEGPDTMHIERKIVVKDSPVKVIAKLRSEGYDFISHGDEVRYSRRKRELAGEEYFDDPYESQLFQTVWSETGNVK